MKKSIVVLAALLGSFVSFNGFSQVKPNKVLTAKKTSNCWTP
ncbi:hypothetical protein OQX61_00690 [Pedobacter sp. PLR]|nr:hypothetical protein [Pedobacter sp. PLR]MCX2449771.1 hypothetical protein [Pedobacter sp. PLR]